VSARGAVNAVLRELVENLCDVLACCHGATSNGRRMAHGRSSVARKKTLRRSADLAVSAWHFACRVQQ